MAIDYLKALKDYADSGGKDINEFLNQHVVAPKLPPGVVTPAAAATETASVAARLAAADSRDRLLGKGAPLGNTGNIITNPTLRPVTAESNALQAKIAARAQPGGVVVQPANAPVDPFTSPIGPPVRTIAPSFAGGATADTANPVPNSSAWWAARNAPQPLITPPAAAPVSRFGTGAFGHDLEAPIAGAKPVGTGLIRLNRNTFIPQTVNYNNY